MTDEVLTKFKRQIAGWTMVPSDGGKFEVTIDGKLVFSKLEQDRFPSNAEIIELIEKQMAASS